MERVKKHKFAFVILLIMALRILPVPLAGI